MRQLLFLLVLLPTAAWAVDTPGVDQQRSWYDTAFTLTITAPAGASLRYTTDGSRPSASHGTAAGTRPSTRCRGGPGWALARAGCGRVYRRG